MSQAIIDNHTPNFWRTMRLAFTYSFREMRGGLKGFRIFLACVALGVAAIGSVNTIADAITSGLEREGRTILGGDIRFELNQRRADNAELAYLENLGKIAVMTDMRSMARRADGADQTLVELKAVDNAYPLTGALVTEPQLDKGDMFTGKNGVYGVAVAPLLLDRLNVKIGDQLSIGAAKFEIRSTIITEPDVASDGFGFAPRAMISMQGLEASNLVQPGSLVEFQYKIALNDELVADTIRDEATKKFPDSGWSIRTASNAAPALARNIERFSQFLTLVGLSALVVGGLGVANAVRAHLDSKRGVIATLKSLGGSGGFVFTLYLAQVMILALCGILLGLAIAAIAPILVGNAIQQLLPVPLVIGFNGSALGLAALFGALATMTFAISPLGLSRNVPATDLFRNTVISGETRPKPIYRIVAGLFALALAALAFFNAGDQRVGIAFIGGVIAVFLVLRLVAMAIQAIAKRVPKPASIPVRMALGNIYRPGALTPSVVLSLGLGLTILAAIALIDSNLRNQISGNLTDRAPNFFFADIRSTDADHFADEIAKLSPTGKLIRVPMLRGRVTAINGKDPSTIDVPPEGQWVLRGDRGITYAKNTPENSTLSAGKWWPEDYSGEPLVSFSAEEAGEIGLTIGDTVSVNVLGRTITARIANLREVEWESLGINFVMVFSPNTFAGAPHSWLATLTLPKTSTETEIAVQEGKIVNTIANIFPAVTTVRVTDALDVVNRVIGQLGAAVRAAAIVAIAASILVLAGALAAGNRARQRDAVILKTLGATRRTLMKAYLAEYAILGLATGLFALLFGSIAAWYVIGRVMTLNVTIEPLTAMATLGIALIVTIGTGLAGTWSILGQRAAPALREP